MFFILIQVSRKNVKEGHLTPYFSAHTPSVCMSLFQTLKTMTIAIFRRFSNYLQKSVTCIKQISNIIFQHRCALVVESPGGLSGFWRFLHKGYLRLYENIKRDSLFSCILAFLLASFQNFIYLPSLLCVFSVSASNSST